MILGHTSQIDFFLKNFSSKFFHHAWLLKGPKGIGKFTSALYFAKEILKNSFIDAQTHPNLKIIHREDQASISVEHVRKSLDFLSQTMIDGGWKILIIDSVGELNTHSQNALLKCLEEPKQKTLFLLVCHDGEKILPTIRSRVIPLNFHTIPKESIIQYIKQNYPSLASSHLYAELASGSIGRLNYLIQNNGLTLYQTMVEYLVLKKQSAICELALKYDPLFLGEMITLIYKRCVLFQSNPPSELIFETEQKDLQSLFSALDWRKIGTFFTRLHTTKTLHLEQSALFID